MRGEDPSEAGRDAENTRSADLVEELHKVGLPTAKFERLFRVRKTGGRMAPSKPDITIRNGGVHVVSAKWGQRKELEAVNSADEYRADLEPQLAREGKQLGEVMAVTYPASQSETYILHLRPREGRKDLCIRLRTLPELALRISIIVQGRIAEIEKEQEPVFDEAKRFLHLGTQEISNSIRGVPDALLEEVWGGHDFFRSLLLPKLKGEQRKEALRSGAGYLFVNQVLFYCLLAEAAQSSGGELARRYGRIDPADFDSPKRLRENYFEKVHSKDYEPIYALNIAQFLTSPSAASTCRDVVRSLASLAPKLTVPDLIGHVFQEFIDPTVRKKLGACYTNPNAGALLASLSVPSWDCSVLDPACGSGTLLVAAYRRKAALARGKDPSTLHHNFVEREITGIEAMGFAAHLAAVNLALQRPLVDTDYVRIAVSDSTSKRPSGPRSVILPWDVSAPREFRQERLDMDLTRKPTRAHRRIVELSKRAARPIHLRKVDLVIMNPPFTSWHQMGESYRESLKKSFSQERSTYREAISGKFSQQGFFLMLGDLFLKEEGTLAAVLPLSTFTTVAFSRLVEQFLTDYCLKSIVVGFGRSAFSEVSHVTECLFVAEKRQAPENHRFSFVGVFKHPDEWTPSEIESIVAVASSGDSRNEVACSLSIPQSDLISGKETIVGLLHRLQPEFSEARRTNTEALSRSAVQLIKWGELREKLHVEVHRWVLGSELFSFYGPKALFISRTLQRALSDNDRLVFDSFQQNNLVAKDRVTGQAYSFPMGAIVPALRRFGNITALDSRAESDFAVSKPTPELERVMRDLYSVEEAELHLRRIKEISLKFPKGRWIQRIQDGSSRLSIGIRFDLSAPGTTVLACRNDSPTFLAAYGFMVSGLDARAEKLFCLWANSSLFLVQVLSHMTPTEGPWCKFEKSFVEEIPFPDFEKLSDQDWQSVEKLYNRTLELSWPSLVDQLKGAPVKILVDDGLLELLGIRDSTERERVGKVLRAGALATIEALKETMGK